MIELHDITKSFAGARVLNGVRFSLAAGRILGLVGENGAGKSTLMNILGGILQPDSGRMAIAGQPYAPRHPNDATAAGIAFVHQELNLFPNLNLAENLFLTAFPIQGSPSSPRKGFGLSVIDRRRLFDMARQRLDVVGLRLDPQTPVERLSAGERQLVEIARALGEHARCIILDEPTTSLSARESARLFELLQQLRQDGIAMIYISHHLGDVLRGCDEVLVLRDGEVVGAGPRPEFTAERLISLMVGRSLKQLFPERRAPVVPPAESSASNPVLEVRGASRRGIVRDISFRLHRGEVLGVAGLMGAGRSELARILFGLDGLEQGEVLLDGRPLAGSPRRRIQRGLAFLTEDRRADGLCLEAAVADNIALVSLRRLVRTPLRLLDRGRWREAIRSVRDAVKLQPSVQDVQPACTLSGGNQQKVVLAKWLLSGPGAILLDEPTRGIDVGAKFEVYQLILELADRGAGVLFISSEIEDLIGLCDRILVMNRGEIRASFDRAEFDRERILQAALPAEERPA